MARVFELRTYYAEPGKFEALSDRFRNGSVELFIKHGMEVVGFWEVSDPDQAAPETLVYLLAFPSREAADVSWTAFRADPEWQSMRERTETDGPLAAKIESVFLNPTDYSNMK